MYQAAAEVIAAYREHTAMMLVGGHEPTRLNTAMDALKKALEQTHKPSDGASR